MKKCLIVVDMLNDFLRLAGNLYVPNSEVIIPTVRARVNEYRMQGNAPIIFLCDSHKEDDKEFDIWPKHCVEGTDGANIIEELMFGSSLNDVVIKKTRYSGFFKTGLDEMLKSIKPDVVEVMGLCANICVMDTVGGLANRDYPTVVHRNCVADLTPQMKNWAIERMAMIYKTAII